MKTMVWVLVLILFFLTGCNQRATLRIGDTPKRVELTDNQGKKRVFPDEWKGRVVMVRFWSVSCPSCNKEILKSMEALYQKYRDKGFTAISINVNSTPELAEEFQRLDKFITFPVIVDPDSSVSRHYGVATFPTTFILNRAGVVTEKVIGETGIDMFESFLPPLL
ncbi:MAG: TlpA disulfide reductase family protein [Methylococcaceae bacterium]|nr:TlpA disulfide reductase family protein [Methylococcaceae bacterium]